MKIAIYPGTFDPLTNGHLDIITRASKLVEKLYVLVSINPNKKCVFSVEERKEIVRKSCQHLKNVEVASSQKLVLDFAHEIHADAIVRGLRNHNDFDAEMQLFQFNHTIDSNVETIFLFPSANNLFLSSSSVKELVMFDSDITNYVPNIVKDEIKDKLKERLKSK